MKEQTMSTIQYDMLYLLSCGVNKTKPQQNILEQYKSDDRKLMQLYRFSKQHFVEALTGTVLKQAGVTLPDPWEKDMAKAVRKVILFDAERARILSFMEQRGIWYLPLKGIILKKFYPSVGMRQMSDNDILFDEAFAEQVREYMVSLGYEVISFGEGNHDVYEKEPVYNFELHRALYGAAHDNNWEQYYRDVKERMIREEGSSYGYHMKPEDFYIYIMCHGYKHYQGGGTGIRTLLDFYVYLESLHSEMDFAYIEKECETLGLSEFEKRNRALCRKVFGDNAFAELPAEERVPDTAAHTTKEIITKALSQEELDMLQYYMTSGVYGTFDHRIENNVKKYSKNGGSSKLRYVIKRIFPGMETYQYYPFFYKHKWLLPVCWLYRLLRVVFQRERRERILREADAVRKVKV